MKMTNAQYNVILKKHENTPPPPKNPPQISYLFFQSLDFDIKVCLAYDKFKRNSSDYRIQVNWSRSQRRTN